MDRPCRLPPSQTVSRLALVAAGLLLAVGCAGGSQHGPSDAAAVGQGRPRHWITVYPGQSRTYAPGTLGVPLTIACPRPVDALIGSGLTQVIRSPLQRAKTALYGDSLAGASVTVAVTATGSTRVRCSYPMMTRPQRRYFLMGRRECVRQRRHHPGIDVLVFVRNDYPPRYARDVQAGCEAGIGG